jgi:hypothetical protein
VATWPADQWQARVRFNTFTSEIGSSSFGSATTTVDDSFECCRVTIPSSFNGQPYDSWDPDAAIELGNAWITFGNTFNTQLGNMSTALYSLTEGPWASGGSVAAEDAFAAVYELVQPVINSCWDVGEMINHYAMLRTDQEKTGAKETWASTLASLVVNVGKFGAGYAGVSAVSNVEAPGITGTGPGSSGNRIVTFRSEEGPGADAGRDRHRRPRHAATAPRSLSVVCRSAGNQPARRP